MQENEARIRILEDSLKRAWSAINNLIGRMIRAESRIQSIGSGGGGGTSGGGNPCYCLPTTLGGATGTWPALTPASESLTVYMVSGTTITSLGTFTVYNWFPATPAVSLVLLVLPDGAGNYVAVSQSCS